MRTSRFMTLAAAASAMLCGCAKEDNLRQNENMQETKVYMTVSASTTRTSIDEEHKIFWAEGDRIGLFYDTDEVKAEWNMFGSTVKNGFYQNLPYVLRSEADGAAYGAFTITNDDEHDHPSADMPYTGNFYWQGSTSETTFYACYPFAIYKDYYNGLWWNVHSFRAFPFLLPSAQGGTIADAAALDLSCGSATVARGSEEYVEADLNFGLKHLLAMLEFTVENNTGAELTVEKLKFEAGENIAGLLEVDMTVPKVVSASVSSVTATLETPAVLAAGESVKIYIMAAPADCSDGSITLTTSAGNHTFTGGTTFGAGKYYTKTLSVEGAGSSTESITIDFEDAELKSVTYKGTYTSATYNNVLEGKSFATEVDDDDSYFDGTMLFHGILYERDGVGIGSMYNDGQWMMYGVNDNWSGIALSSNCDTESKEATNQFSVYKSDNGSNKFAMCYDAPSAGMVFEELTYDTPTIVFKKKATVKSIDFMNATYTVLTIKSIDPEAVFAIKITGYSGNSATKSITLTLYDGSTMIEDWKTVDLSTLGEVDKLTLQVDTDATRASDGKPKPANWMPFFWCIDNIVVEPAQ